MSDPGPKNPVSWLRLERYALGELDADEAAAVAAAVGPGAGDGAGVGADRLCLDRIESDERVLPALPEPEAKPGLWAAWWPPRPMAWAGTAATLALAGVLVFAVRGGGPGPQETVVPGPRTRTKGGELVISLVRERGGRISHEPEDFAAGDRFKVVVTCPGPDTLHGEVVVFQDQEVAFPLPTVELSCGNRVPLPGAFRLSGTAPVTVCLVYSDEAPPDRDRLSPIDIADLPPAVCTSLQSGT